eukprot:1018645-Pyramimonas_sp.AAC.2
MVALYARPKQLAVAAGKQVWEVGEEEGEGAQLQRAHALIRTQVSPRAVQPNTMQYRQCMVSHYITLQIVQYITMHCHVVMFSNTSVRFTSNAM